MYKFYTFLFIYYISSDVSALISDKIISHAMCRYVTNSFEIIFIF